jgi:hypothetical protein
VRKATERAAKALSLYTATAILAWRFHILGGIYLMATTPCSDRLKKYPRGVSGLLLHGFIGVEFIALLDCPGR